MTKKLEIQNLLTARFQIESASLYKDQCCDPVPHLTSILSAPERTDFSFHFFFFNIRHSLYILLKTFFSVFSSQLRIKRIYIHKIT